MRVHTIVICALCLVGSAAAQAPSQPPPPEVAGEITALRATLAGRIRELETADTRSDRLADVKIYLKAAEWITRHGEFFRPDYGAKTVLVLKSGIKRANQLLQGSRPWENATGRVCRGYLSRVDRSVQPYALVIPRSYDSTSSKRWRLDVLLHGRNSRLTESSFIAGHETSKAAPAEEDFVQLEVYGRGNNAYRWAGESDVLEAIESVKRRYRIDDRRVVLRGFSMGGAGAWHLGLHHSSEFCSVGPGAGFSDTKKYQNIQTPLPSWQDDCLHIYDAVDYAENAFNVPIVAYGGENDKQLQASVNIKSALESLGVRFVPDGLNATTEDLPFLFLVGPKTGHKFHPESFARAMQFHATHAVRGQRRLLRRLRFVTYTLKYPGGFGYRILRMGRHYRPATIRATEADNGVIEIQASNVEVLEVARGLESIQLGGRRFGLSDAADGLLPDVLFHKKDSGWELLDYASSRALQRSGEFKRPGLQGPIDDAFTGPFLCVQGTGTPWSEQLGAWAEWNLERFKQEWDKWMRGELPVKKDRELTAEDIANYHLILFGDPGSNSVIARIVDRLAVHWNRSELGFGKRRAKASDHGIILVSPNPLNRDRYVVINSGHTFHRQQFLASNAQLFPRCGDYALIRFKPERRQYSERIVDAGLFDEQWQLAED